jgi:hypothetical protein
MPTPPEVQALRDAQDAAGKLFQRDAEVRAAHAAALKARHKLAWSPPPVDEVLANMRRLVDERAAAWLRDNARAIYRDFGGDREAKVAGSVLQHRPALWRRPGHYLDVPDLVGLAPELMKARFEEAIRSQASSAGPEAVERARLVAEMDAEISAIEETHTALVDAAAALPSPIAIALLPAVQSRRSAEEARRKREADEIEARQRAAATVNEKLPSTARSAYIRQPPRGETIADPFGA